MIGASNSPNLNCNIRVMKEAPGPSVSEEIADIFRNYTIDIQRPSERLLEMIAFDSLPYYLLISKLHVYGLSIPAPNLMVSYQQDRKQRVKLGPQRSTWNNLTNGVPQGYILGPVLFNIFMSNLFHSLENARYIIMLMITPCQMHMHLLRLKRQCWTWSTTPIYSYHLVYW